MTPTAPSSDRYVDLLELAAAEAFRYLRGLPERPVSICSTDAGLRQWLGGPLPQRPTDGKLVLDDLVAGVGKGLMPSGSGRYFGYVVGGTLPVAMAADWLTSAWDQNCIVHDGSPATAVVEEICGEWLVDLCRLRPGTSVAFTPACTHADLLGLTVARHAVLARAGWDVAEHGLAGAPPVTVLINESIHAAVVRPLQLLGLGGSIRALPVDSEARIREDALDEAIAAAAGGPLIVCGHIGEINTGGADRLRLLAEKTHAAGGWLHLDAAFGMWAAASPRLRHTLADGIELADSIGTDAHKALNVPYDCGIAFIADKRAHQAAFPLSADYLHLDPHQRHPVQWGIEVSRRARVFPLWAALRTLGRDGVAELVDRLCDHARTFADLLAAEPGIEIVNDVVFNQVLAVFHHPHEHTDTHTRNVAAAFQQQGEAWAAISRWQGRTVLRISVSNWATTEEDVQRAAAALKTTHHKLLGQGDML